MIGKAYLSSKYFLFIFILIGFQIFLVSYALGEEVVKGKLDVPFETGFFSDEPDDESKAKALKKGIF